MSAPIGPGERWAPMDGAEAHYEVSTLGRVRRLHTMRWGTLPALGFVECRPNNHGYLMFNTICEGRGINRALHRLVLLAFVGPCPEGQHAAHLNGDRTDPRLENLAYVTPKQNAAHKVEHGTDPVGERNPSSKLTEAQVREIRASTDSNPVLAARYGLNRFHVSDIRRGAMWKHVKGDPATDLLTSVPAEPERIGVDA